MSSIGKVKGFVARSVGEDAEWLVPLVLYKVSGRRLAYSSELYRSQMLRGRLRRLPGMTTPTERAYFKWHAQETFLGRGEVVDLGCWLGSTTAALSMGLVANRRRAARKANVHAYDHFLWEWWMQQYSEETSCGPYSPGDSFLQEFERIVAPWRSRIQVHVGDLLEQHWDGRGIEVLLVDAMKSWDLSYHILTRFYRFLVEGDGYVLHQDFGHCYTPWIHLISYRLRDYLVPVQDVVRSDTVVFRLVRSFEHVPSMLELRRASFDDEEVEQAFAYSLRITRPEKHSSIRAAQALLLVQDGNLAAAQNTLRMLEQRGQLNEYDRNAVRSAIDDVNRAYAN